MRLLFVMPIVLGLANACVSNRVVPQLDITVMPLKFDQTSKYQKRLSELEELRQQHPEWGNMGQDIDLILKAMHFEKIGERHSASEAWLQYIRGGRGELAQYAFERWIPLMNSILGSSAKDIEVARFFWREAGAETWLSKIQGFKTEEDVHRYIKGEGADAALDLSVKLKEIEGQDVLRKKAARLYCKSQKDNIWRNYQLSLKGLERQYWKALTLVCMDLRVKALAAFKRLDERMKKIKGYQNLHLVVLRNIVDINRYLGDREGVAEGFLALSKAMERAEIGFKQMDLDSEFDWHYMKINTRLWAARYKALVGEYELASDLAKEAQLELKGDKWQGLNLSDDQQSELVELLAESHHILANRILFEKGDFSAAQIQNSLGMAVGGLNDAWRDRFRWFDGWYAFHLENYERSIDSWEVLMDETGDESLKEKSLFWLAKTSLKLGKRGDFEGYLEKLYKEHPLGFYSVPGVQMSSWSKEGWLTKNYAMMEKKLATWNLDISKIDRSPELKNLRVRAEMAILIADPILGPRTAMDLYRAVRKNIKLKYSEPHLYVSRLLYLNNKFALAMGYTTDILIANSDLWQDYPEQILVYYPRPYLDLMMEYSKGRAFDKEFLLAIARQESAFESDAESWAGAVGLLQLMPNTAQKYSRKSYSEGQLQEKLTQPPFNLEVASRYIAFLHKYYDKDSISSIAAYNAGEYVVDRWSKVRRFGEDPIQWIENIPFSETQNYVKKVMRNWWIYKAIYRLDLAG